MSAKNCTSTLIIGGLEFKVQSPNVNGNPPIKDIIQNIIKEHGSEISKALSDPKGVYEVLNINDISHLRGNATFKDITKHLNSLGRQYIPMRDSLRVLISKLNKVVPESEQNILWVSSPITLNDVKVPNVNVSSNGDLVILDSNNLNKVYNTLREYFYAKTINTPEKINQILSFIGSIGKATDKMKLKSDIWIANLQSKFTEMRKNPATALHYIVSDDIINELVDLSGMRSELNTLLRTLSNVQLKEGKGKQWWLEWNGNAGTYINRNGQQFRFNFKEMDTTITGYLKEKGIEANEEEIKATKAVLLSGISQGHPLSDNEIYDLWDEFTRKGCE